MSHEVETLAYSGQVPWHGLGVRVDDDITPDEMLVKAGLDWEVSLKPLAFQDNTGQWIQSDRRALVRDSDQKYLSAVGERWQPTQNRDALGFFNDFVEAGQMTMETAGSLKEGKHVFGLARISRDFEVVKGDAVRGYILFHNPHIFGKAIEVMQTSIRVVCNNTLTAALHHDKAGNRYSSSHMMKFDKDDAIEQLGLAQQKVDEYEEAAKFLVSRRTTPQKLENYFKKVFPSTGQSNKMSRNAKMALDAIDYQPGVDVAGVAGTWWNAFNAVTYVADHHLGRSQDNRMANSWFGSNRARKSDALEIALEYADKAESNKAA